MRKGVKNLYRKYLALLSERKTTTSAVCKATEIKESAMSMWKSRWLAWEKTKEGAEPVPSLETIAKLAKYFDKPIEFFIGE